MHPNSAHKIACAGYRNPGRKSATWDCERETEKKARWEKKNENDFIDNRPDGSLAAFDFRRANGSQAGRRARYRSSAELFDRCVEVHCEEEQERDQEIYCEKRQHRRSCRKEVVGCRRTWGPAMSGLLGSSLMLQPAIHFFRASIASCATTTGAGATSSSSSAGFFGGRRSSRFATN